MEQKAIVDGKNLMVSAKQVIEIAKLIRNKPLKKSKIILQDVLKMKQAVPMRSHNIDTGHKPGMGPGRYPQNASKAVLQLLDSLESNAEKKGINVDSLYITKAIGNRASRPWKMGRQRRTKARRAHLYLEAMEIKKEDKK